MRSSARYICAISADTIIIFSIFALLCCYDSQKKRQRIASRKAAAQDTSTQAELLAEQNALFQAATRKAAQEGW